MKILPSCLNEAGKLSLQTLYTVSKDHTPQEWRENMIQKIWYVSFNSWNHLNVLFTISQSKWSPSIAMHLAGAFNVVELSEDGQNLLMARLLRYLKKILIVIAKIKNSHLREASISDLPAVVRQILLQAKEVANICKYL